MQPLIVAQQVTQGVSDFLRTVECHPNL